MRLTGAVALSLTRIIRTGITVGVYVIDCFMLMKKSLSS